MLEPKRTWVAMTRYANRTLKNPRIRTAAIQAYRRAMSLNRLLPPPRMFLVGPPKSGTHLLSDCVSMLPRTTFSGRRFVLHDYLADGEDPRREPFTFAEPRPRLNVVRTTRFLQACAPGMFVTSHARWNPLLQPILEDLGYRTVFLLRDPRDIAVSLASYILREPHHNLHRYHAQYLDNGDDRLMAVITGFDAPDEDTWSQPSIGEDLSGYLPWMRDGRALVVRFEDLVGERGGGTADLQLSRIKAIADHLQRPVDEATAAEIAQRMYSRSSATFRKGEIGDWRNHFTDEHRDAFKKVAGDLLIQLGYEDNLDW